jgi:broad specificity phosphatase PhoE
VTVLHFVRHCDVENPHGIIYGRLPGFGLSALGRAQAERVAHYLSERPIAEIYSSPQLRAAQTARAIRRHHPRLRVRISRRLAEVDTSYQGLKSTDVPSTINMFDNPKDPGDETMADVYRRMSRFVERVTCLHQGLEVVCVSHAAPIAILRVGLEGRPFTVDALRGSAEPPKGSITTIIFDDGPPTITRTEC